MFLIDIDEPNTLSSFLSSFPCLQTLCPTITLPTIEALSPATILIRHVSTFQKKKQQKNVPLLTHCAPQDLRRNSFQNFWKF